jgi:hypothetical protein
MKTTAFSPTQTKILLYYFENESIKNIFLYKGVDIYQFQSQLHGALVPSLLHDCVGCSPSLMLDEVCEVVIMAKREKSQQKV